MKTHLRYLTVALAAGAVIFAGCESATVPDLNAPSTNELAGPLTAPVLNRLVSGLVNSVRANAGLGYFYFGEAFARDAYRFDPSESRFISEAYTRTPSRTSFFGGSQFNGFYTSIRAGTTIIKKLDEGTQAYNAAQISAIKGFVRTMQAFEYYHVWEYHDTLGTPLQMADSSKLGAILCSNSALAYISSLLDTANRDLAAAVTGGVTSFPFDLPSGFLVDGDFTNITVFRKGFNRGLKGKVEVYRGIGRETPGPAAAFDTAIAVLDTAIGPTPTSMADLNRGPYYQYSTAPGEIANPLADPNLRLNQRVGDSVQAGDLRASKITRGDTSAYTASGYTYTTEYYPTNSLTTRPANFVNPIGMLRVEELVLLRAQAKIEKNDLAGALVDINIVRTISGGLPALTLLQLGNQANARQILLREKRYSLLFEGPQRLVDLRAYKLLNAANLPKEGINAKGVSGDKFNSALFIPQSESDVRGGNVTPVCQ